MSSETAQGRSDEQTSALVERIVRGELGEFTGSLAQLALAELIRALEHGRKGAQIRIDHDGEQGHVWCEGGQVVDARSGPLVGAPALYRLLELRHGRVYARFVRSERARTIHASTAALLREAAQRQDECRELRQRIGDTSAVYIAGARVWAAQAHFAPERWQMLRAFDGVSSVERVVSLCGAPELESLSEIVALLDQGLLEPRPEPSAPQWMPLGAERSSRTQSAEQSVEQQGDGPESSFVPFAGSLRARLTSAPQRRRLWWSAAAGAGAVVSAFAVGFWSVRHETAGERPARPALASANDWAQAARGGCPPGLARMAGGPLFPSSLEPAPAGDGSRVPRIAPFCLARTEVTVEEFAACVDAQACAPTEHDLRQPHVEPAPAADGAPRCNAGRAGRERHPINCVTFEQAQQFCGWRGGRLPRQVEWEYAAQEVVPDPQESHQGTLAVGSFPAGGNPEGVLDLLGNVSEWTTGRVGLRSTGAEGDGSRPLYAVLGGGLQPGASRLGSRASRLYMNANARGRNVGFRCAFDL